MTILDRVVCVFVGHDWEDEPAPPDVNVTHRTCLRCGKVKYPVPNMRYQDPWCPHCNEPTWKLVFAPGLPATCVNPECSAYKKRFYKEDDA